MYSSQITSQSDLFSNRQKTTPSIREKALKIFSQPQQNAKNPKLAEEIGVSLRRFYQMKKEFQQTGTIKLTNTYKHKEHYLRKRALENHIIRTSAQSKPTITCQQISEKLKERGIVMRRANVNARLCYFGMNKGSVARQCAEFRSQQSKQTELREFCLWIQDKKQENLYYSAAMELDMERKMIGKCTLQVYLTIGIQGIVGWNIFRKNKSPDLFITHLQQNYFCVKSYTDCLVLEPSPLTQCTEVSQFLISHQTNYFYLPIKGQSLNPLLNLFQELRMELNSWIADSQAVGANLRLSDLINHLENMLYQYNEHKLREYYVQVKNNVKQKCLE